MVTHEGLVWWVVILSVVVILFWIRLQIVKTRAEIAYKDLAEAHNALVKTVDRWTSSKERF